MHRDPIPDLLYTALRDRFGERFSQGESVRLQHGRDESVHIPEPPDAVVFAQSTEDVAAVVTLCRQHHVPVIAYGAGSSVEGHLLAVEGLRDLTLEGEGGGREGEQLHDRTGAPRPEVRF